MYYYIVEQLATSAEKKKIEDIKALLAQLGIAGEFVLASPAKTVEEHLELAFSKGFTTIVGIGSDALANRIASTLVRTKYEKAAMGLIPLDNKQRLWKMVGAVSINEICQSLRSRRVTTVDAISLDRRHSFITQANIISPTPISFQIGYNKLEMSGLLTNLTIHNNGLVEFWDQSSNISPKKPGSFLKRFFLEDDDSNLSKTSFMANHWYLATEPVVAVMVDGQKMTETPLEVKRHREALKLIVNRARIATDKESD